MKTESMIFDELFVRFPQLVPQSTNITKAAEIIIDAYDRGGKVLACGNGGSAADADHIVGELMKGFLLKRPLKDDLKERLIKSGAGDSVFKLQQGLPAISLCAHAGLMTAYINDCEAESVFAQQVIAYSSHSPDDVLIGLSTSGNSKNVVLAVKAANAVGIRSIAITGANESELSKIASVCIRLPETETFKIQELTLPVYHCLCAVCEAHFFSE